MLFRSRTRSSPLDPLSRLCVRRWLDCSVFSLASGLPSTTSAVGLPPLFGCFAGTTPLYDSPPPCMVDLSLIAFSSRPAALRPRVATGSLGSRAAQRAPRFYACMGSSTPQGTARSRSRAPLYCLPTWLTPSAPWFAVFGAQYPARICPCPTLQVQPYDCPRMARGQDGRYSFPV